MAIEPTPENIAKAKQIIAEHEQSAEEDERIAAWLQVQSDDLYRQASRSRSVVQPYKDWLAEAERPSVPKLMQALEDSLAAAKAEKAGS